MTQSEKLARLHEALRGLPPAWMAVSGGVDSRFLAYTAWGLGLDWPAVFFSGPTSPPGSGPGPWLGSRSGPHSCTS